MPHIPLSSPSSTPVLLHISEIWLAKLFLVIQLGTKPRRSPCRLCRDRVWNRGRTRGVGGGEGSIYARWHIHREKLTNLIIIKRKGKRNTNKANAAWTKRSTQPSERQVNVRIMHKQGMARGTDRARKRGGGLRGRCQITLDKVEMQLKSFAKAESTCTGRVYLGTALLCSGLAAAWQGKGERV